MPGPRAGSRCFCISWCLGRSSLTSWEGKERRGTHDLPFVFYESTKDEDVDASFTSELLSVLLFNLNGFAVLCHRTGFALQPLSSPSALRWPHPPNTECLSSSPHPSQMLSIFFNHAVSSHCFPFRFSPLVGSPDCTLSFGSCCHACLSLSPVSHKWEILNGYLLPA